MRRSSLLSFLACFFLIFCQIGLAADPAVVQKELTQHTNGPARGPKNASVTIVEFADLQCPACKAAYPIMERLVADEPGVRFIYQPYPLTQVHPWALKAASWAQCIAEQSNPAFWKFIGLVYTQQESITVQNVDQKLGTFASLAGVDRAKTAACSETPTTAEKINQSIALGKSVEVTGTPTVFINGRKVEQLFQTPYEMLRQQVKDAAKQPK